MLKNERVRARKLTQLAAEKLKPGPTRREVPDGDGLYLIIQVVA
jgi:hypothetical protein